MVSPRPEYQRCFSHPLMDLFVIYSRSVMKNGSEWHHISLSRPDRLPSWSDVAKVKEDFLGTGGDAIHVIPKKRDHVNVHQYCLHIWESADGKNYIPNLQDITMEHAK